MRHLELEFKAKYDGRRLLSTYCKTEFFTANQSAAMLLVRGVILKTTEYIFYCKRAILFLSSSKILTPHPSLRLASLSSPRKKGGSTHSPGGEGEISGQIKELLKHQDILCSGSMTFGCGSGSVIDLQDANK
jgi:hypothetical protein